MNPGKRPISILMVACVYLAVGSIGFMYHLRELRHPPGVWIELTEFLAILAGAFMLRGKNWARWLALAWIAFHVILSAFRTIQELLIHCFLLVVIAWLLFRPQGRRYFRGAEGAMMKDRN